MRILIINLFLIVLCFSCKKEELKISSVELNGPDEIIEIGEYSSSAINGATYEWTISEDFYILEGQGTWKIKVKPKKSFAAGELCVKIKTKDDEKKICKPIRFNQFLIRSMSINIPGRRCGILYCLNNMLYFGMGTADLYLTQNIPASFSKFYKMSSNFDSANPILIGNGPLNLKRSSPVYFTNANKAYLGFGTDANSNSYSDFWEFDPVNQIWTQLASNINLPAEATTNFVINTKAYIIGGRNLSGAKKTNCIYDFQTNNWSTGAPIPTAIGKYDANSFSDGTFGYILGGTDAVNIHSDFYKYDPQTDSWTTLNNYPGYARRAGLLFKVGNNVYYGGGYDSIGGLTDFWKLDLTNGNWTNLPTLPFSIQNAAFCSANNSGYFFGGIIYSNFSYNLISDVYEIKF